jgi:cell wall-associated NlpC family hydrolase
MVDVKRGQRAFALSLAVLVVAAICVLPAPAGADAIGDKQAEANAIAGKIDQLNHTIERNAELANEAQIELDGLNQQVLDAQGKVAAAQAEHDKHEGELRDYAVNAYVHGTDAVSQAQASIGSDPGDQGQRQGYLTAASGNRQQLIDSLRATEQDLNARIGQLDQAKGAAEAKARDLKNQQSAAQSAVQQQQSLYNQAQGELATLVQQAQQRAAAEQQAAAEARAAAAQAQAQARAQAQAQAQAQAAPATGRGAAAAAPAARAPSPRAPAPPAPAAPSAPPSGNGGAGAAIAEAQRQLGKPYVWGAAGPNAFDCSGLTAWAWRAGGVSLPHFSGAQYASTTHVSMSAIQPGDLIFYESPDQHVALYVGGGQIIHAPHAGSVVKYDSLYYWNVTMMASRP